MTRRIPITVFTGYLGSGKTTIILDLVKQLPGNYKTVLLKNEFGNTAVDSELAKQSSIGVKEYLNGCLCCVLVGKIKNALEELDATYHPDRIIIETSGSAYPGPIAWEIRQMPGFFVDGIVTVIDALNFPGYKDKSYTAKLQTKETDLILINKHELVPERKLDEILDDVYTLNPTTPKIKTDKGRVSPDIVFGLDSQLFQTAQEVRLDAQSHDLRHHQHEVELFECSTDAMFNKAVVSALLSSLPASDMIRIKGMIRTPEGPQLVNYVFGRFDLIPLPSYTGKTALVFMGTDIESHAPKIKKTLELADKDCVFTPLAHDSRK